MPKFSNDALEGVHAKDYADIVVRRMKGRTVRADWPGTWRKHK